MRYKHQKQILRDDPKYFGLWFDCRCGKTRSAIELAEQDGKSCLVITPKSLTINFENEIKIWSKDKNYKWLVVGKEEFRIDWDKYEYYDGVIWDEVHYAGNPKSQLYKNFIKYIKKTKPKFIYGLSATPYRSSAMNAYALAKVLNYKINYRVFYDQCYTMVRMGNRMIPIEKKCAKQVVEKVLKKIGRFVSMEEVVGNENMPKKINKNEYFDLNKEQKKIIEELLDIEPIARFTHEAQIAGGCLKGDGYTKNQFIKSEKLERVKQIIEENDKTVVVCHYLLEQEIIQKTCGGEILNGSLGKKERDDLINKANQKKSFTLIIQADMAEGYSLKTFDLMIFYSLSWSAVSYIQMKARITAVDKNTPVEYIHFITKNCVDEHIFNCVVEKKADFIAKLYEKEGKKSHHKINPLFKIG
jgi:hypothetical protein